MAKIKKIKQMQPNGQFSDYIPIGVDAKYVDLEYTDNNVENILKKKPYYFNNIEEMKNCKDLIVGDMVITLGYYEKNDNGSASYFITDTKSNNKFYENLENGLFAELIINDIMNLKCFGIKENDVDDDTDLLQSIINLTSYNKNFEIKGNKQPLIISKTILIPADCKISNVAFKTRTNNFTKNFMLAINTTDLEKWSIAYPNSTIGFLKYCSLENENTNNIINGILNFSNNHFENLKFVKLNTAFKNSTNYLDMVIMNNFSISRKIGTDYALDLGYLGDGCELNQVHMYDTIGTHNYINVGNGHNPINIQNIIGNGVININHSQVNLLNFHNEEGSGNTQIKINHATVNIENGYFYKNDPNITIDGKSNVTIKNCLFTYNLTQYSYDNFSEIEVEIKDSDSILAIINSYKCLIKSSAIETKILSALMTNKDSIPSTKIIKNYNNQINSAVNNLDDFSNNNLSAAYPQKSSNAKWFQASDTYHYKIVPLFDKQRMLSSNYNAKTSIALSQNSNGFTFAAVSPAVWRIYRGLSEDNYDVYCDIANISNSIHDNGYFVNGFKWKERTPGAIDIFNKNFTYIRHLNNNNVECMCRELPTVGDWRVGDIIHKLNNNVYETYVCTVAGTPGTWVKQS